MVWLHVWYVCINVSVQTTPIYNVPVLSYRTITIITVLLIPYCTSAYLVYILGDLVNWQLFTKYQLSCFWLRFTALRQLQAAYDTLPSRELLIRYGY